MQYVGSILKDVFLIFPQYCLGRGLMDMATEMNINLIVAKFGFISERNRFSWDFLGKYMVCMVVQVRRRSKTRRAEGVWFLVNLFGRNNGKSRRKPIISVGGLIECDPLLALKHTRHKSPKSASVYCLVYIIA